VLQAFRDPRPDDKLAGHTEAFRFFVRAVEPSGMEIS